jgi:hypothetical protein
MIGAAERGFEALQEVEPQRQTTPDEHRLDGLEWPDLETRRTATLWGIIVACLGLAVLAFAWWPL